MGDFTEGQDKNKKDRFKRNRPIYKKGSTELFY
jgi:hypothetical protein